jgi:hypothetical protein
MLGKMLAIQIFDLVYPVIPLAVSYFYLGLEADRFLWAVVAIECTFFVAVGFGLLFSTALSSLQQGSSITPAFIVPMFLVCGFFRDVDSLPWVFWPF